MLHKFNTIKTRGFTLIELLVVIAIIGLLSTIIAAPIQNARKKARDAKKIAELKSLQLAIEQYGESNDSNYPLTVDELSPVYMPLLPTFASSSRSSARDAYAYVVYAASSTGSPTQNFAFHIGSKLEVYGPALDTDRDCIYGYLGSELLDPYCTVFNGDTMQTFVAPTGSLIASTTAAANPTLVTWSPAADAASTSVGRDFYGGKPAATSSDASGRDEDPDSTCKNINDCIFDITSQQ